MQGRPSREADRLDRIVVYAMSVASVEITDVLCRKIIQDFSSQRSLELQSNLKFAHIKREMMAIHTDNTRVFAFFSYHHTCSLKRRHLALLLALIW